jgi:YggT family protein
MVYQALHFILQTFFNLFLIALLLRFYLQVMRAPFRNPFSQFIVAITDFMVKPVRRLIPGLFGFDLGTLLLAWLVALALFVALLWLQPGGFPFAVAPLSLYVGLTLMAIVHLITLSLYILIGVVFAQAILSWVNPYTPIAPVLAALAGPFMRFFQRIVPPIANVDLSPLFIFIACQLVLMLPVAWLEGFARSLM